MPSTCHRLFTTAALLACVLTAITTPTADAADQTGYRKLLRDKSPALVTIKFVLKVKMGGMMGGMGDQESDTEITGVVIDPKGIILCANSQLEGFVSFLRRMMGGMDGELSATPTDLKILIGDDTEGLEAKLISHDSELDLAWIKIKKPGPKPLAYIDFAKGVTSDIGQEFLIIRRLDKFFARTAVIASGRVAGKTDSPRDLLIPDGGTTGALGLPVFTPDGKVLGVTVLQSPEEEGMDPNPMVMLSRISSMQDMMSGFILPSAAVVKATRQALESATE